MNPEEKVQYYIISKWSNWKLSPNFEGLSNEGMAGYITGIYAADLPAVSMLKFEIIDYYNSVLEMINNKEL